VYGTVVAGPTRTRFVRPTASVSLDRGARPSRRTPASLASLRSEAWQHSTRSAALLDEGESMEQDRTGEGPTGGWPWLLLLVVAGLAALVVVMWQSETVRLIWADVWELVRSARR
jgi:hypothetical protein